MERSRKAESGRCGQWQARSYRGRDDRTEELSGGGVHLFVVVVRKKRKFKTGWLAGWVGGGEFYYIYQAHYRSRG